MGDKITIPSVRGHKLPSLTDIAKKPGTEDEKLKSGTEIIKSKSNAPDGFSSLDDLIKSSKTNSGVKLKSGTELKSGTDLVKQKPKEYDKMTDLNELLKSAKTPSTPKVMTDLNELLKPSTSKLPKGVKSGTDLIKEGKESLALETALKGVKPEAQQIILAEGLKPIDGGKFAKVASNGSYSPEDVYTPRDDGSLLREAGQFADKIHFPGVVLRTIKGTGTTPDSTKAFVLVDGAEKPFLTRPDPVDNNVIQFYVELGGKAIKTFDTKTGKWVDGTK